jgi:hypothetical protein
LLISQKGIMDFIFIKQVIFVEKGVNLRATIIIRVLRHITVVLLGLVQGTPVILEM